MAEGAERAKVGQEFPGASRKGTNAHGKKREKLPFAFFFCLIVYVFSPVGFKGNLSLVERPFLFFQGS